jgi:predicted acyltransferase
LLTFVVVRYLDGFGNIRPRMSDSWMAFLSPVKYPPSMSFTLMTTGVNLILLWLFSRVSEGAQRYLQPLVIFGRAPLFFYVLHLFLYAGIGHLVAPEGSSIPSMFPFWLLGLLILFPLCLLYGRFKHRQPANSILRLF